MQISSLDFLEKELLFTSVKDINDLSNQVKLGRAVIEAFRSHVCPEALTQSEKVLEAMNTVFMSISSFMERKADVVTTKWPNDVFEAIQFFKKNRRSLNAQIKIHNRKNDKDAMPLMGKVDFTTWKTAHAKHAFWECSDVWKSILGSSDLKDLFNSATVSKTFQMYYTKIKTSEMSSIIELAFYIYKVPKFVNDEIFYKKISHLQSEMINEAYKNLFFRKLTEIAAHIHPKSNQFCFNMMVLKLKKLTCGHSEKLKLRPVSRELKNLLRQFFKNELHISDSQKVLGEIYKEHRSLNRW